MVENVSKSIAIVIDMWDTTPDYIVESTVKLLNRIKGLQHVIFATYGPIVPVPEHLIPKGAIGRHHPTVQSMIHVDSTQVIPYNYDNETYGWRKLTEVDIENLLELDRKYDFNNIIMCGGAWGNCIQHRSYGIRAIQHVLPYKTILAHQECISLQSGPREYDDVYVGSVINSYPNWQPYQYQGMSFYKYCNALEPET